MRGPKPLRAASSAAWAWAWAWAWAEMGPGSEVVNAVERPDLSTVCQFRCDVISDYDFVAAAMGAAAPRPGARQDHGRAGVQVLPEAREPRRSGLGGKISKS
jgi:hypothetical protein